MPFYIGIMTGNSMDAVDVVYAKADTQHIEQIYFHSYPFPKSVQEDVTLLRCQLENCRSRQDIEKLPLFSHIHDTYIQKIAESVVAFISRYSIPTDTLSAICFHGKTLDHCPPSRKGVLMRQTPYTVQMGSGKMLADIIFRRLKSLNTRPIRVIYDFRSDDIFNGGEGAPLAPVLNAFLARQDNVLNRIDINAGNTSNLSFIQAGTAYCGYDLGPCNEYVDYLIRRHTSLLFDEDGLYAQKGSLDLNLLQELFNQGRSFYEQKPPKSGDPAIYGTQNILAFHSSKNLSQKVHTAVYFAAYLMVYGLKFIQGKIPNNFLLFGGGWKNPVLKETFNNLLNGKGVVLKEHINIFKDIQNRLTGTPCLVHDKNAQVTESLLMVLMGAFFDAHQAWTTPLLTGCHSPTICGIDTVSDLTRTTYSDRLCRACF